MAKKLLVGHQTALFVYRAAGSDLMDQPAPVDGTVTPFDCTTRLSDFSDSGNVHSLTKSCKVDLLAMSENMKHRSSQCQMHTTRGTFPEGSFCSLGRDVLVASPELTVFQSCQDLHDVTSRDRMEWCKDLILEFGRLGELVAAAEICSELCGLYSIVPDGSGDMKRHLRFTDPIKLHLLLSKLRHRPDIRFAQKAAAMASPYSASPRETSVYLAMTAPWPIGYGIEPPAANSPVIVEEDSSLETDEDCRQIRFSDFRWEAKTLRNGRRRKAVTLEYDSDRHHTSSAGLTDQQLWEQGERRDQIEAAGNGFLRMTTSHTKDFSLFDEKMHQLACLLRIELPERSSDEDVLAQRFFELIFDTERFKHVGIFAS